MFITKMNRLFAKHGRVAFGILTMFIIIPFVLYFSSGVNVTEMFAPSRNASGVSMYGKTIKFADLNHLIDQKLLSLSLQWGMPVDFRNSEGRREFLDESLDRARLLREADLLGVKVSDKEVADKIMSTRLFKRDGIFDVDKFNNHVTYYLQPFGIGKADLDEAVRSDLVIDKLKEQITKSVVVTENEIKTYYLLNSEEVLIKVARFKSSDFVKPEAPEEKDLENYLATNQAKYRIPAKYKADVVKFDYAAFEGEAEGKCTDKMLEEHYNANKNKYKEPIEKPLDLVKEEIRKAIIQQRKTASDQEMSSAHLNALYQYCPQGKQLIYLPRYDARASFAHHVKTNMPVEDYEIESYYSKNKQKYTEQAQKPLEKAKDEIKTELVKKEREKLAADKAQRLAIEIYKQIEKDGFAKAADLFVKFFQDKSMPIDKVDWIEASATNVPNIGDEPDLVKEIAKLHPDQPITNAIRGKNFTFVACLTGLEKERDAKLAEVKDKLVKDYKDEKALTLARDTARDVAASIAKALEEKKDFKTAAAETKFEDVPKFTAASSPSGISDAKVIANTTAKLKAGSVSSAVEVPNGSLIVYVESRLIPTNENFASQKDIQSRIYKSKKEQAAWENLRKDLKEQSKTLISKDMRTDKPVPGGDYDPDAFPMDY